MTKLELARNLKVEVKANNKERYLTNKFNKWELQVLTELYNNGKSKEEVEDEYKVILYSEVVNMADDCLEWNDFKHMMQMEDIYLTDNQYRNLYVEDLVNAFEDDGYWILDDRRILC